MVLFLLPSVSFLLPHPHSHTFKCLSKSSKAKPWIWESELLTAWEPFCEGFRWQMKPLLSDCVSLLRVGDENRLWLTYREGNLLERCWRIERIRPRSGWQLWEIPELGRKQWGECKDLGLSFEPDHICCVNTDMSYQVLDLSFLIQKWRVRG